MLRFSCVNPLEVLLRVLHAPTLTTTVKSYFARGGENNKFGSHDELVGAITNESDLAILNWGPHYSPHSEGVTSFKVATLHTFFVKTYGWLPN